MKTEDFDAKTYLESYSSFVDDMVWQPAREAGVLWNTTALASEVGELCQIIEKIYRKGKPVDKEDIKSELGDVLWNVVAIANYYDIPLADVMEYNVDKLSKRTKAT